MPRNQRGALGLTTILASVSVLLVLVILGLGGYYLYSSGTLSRLGFSKGDKTPKGPTATPFPTPVKQAVLQEITPDTDYGSCAELKENPLVEVAELVQRGNEFILVGNLRGKVQNINNVGNEIVQFDLVPEDGGTVKKTLRLKDKAGFVADLEGKVQKLADLSPNQVVELQFNCIRSGTTQNAFVALKLIVDRGNLGN